MSVSEPGFTPGPVFLPPVRCTVEHAGYITSIERDWVFIGNQREQLQREPAQYITSI